MLLEISSKRPQRAVLFQEMEQVGRSTIGQTFELLDGRFRCSQNFAEGVFKFISIHLESSPD